MFEGRSFVFNLLWWILGWRAPIGKGTPYSRQVPLAPDRTQALRLLQEAKTLPTRVYHHQPAWVRQGPNPAVLVGLLTELRRTAVGVAVLRWPLTRTFETALLPQALSHLLTTSSARLTRLGLLALILGDRRQVRLVSVSRRLDSPSPYSSTSHMCLVSYFVILVRPFDLQ